MQMHGYAKLYRDSGIIRFAGKYEGSGVGSVYNDQGILPGTYIYDHGVAVDSLDRNYEESEL